MGDTSPKGLGFSVKGLHHPKRRRLQGASCLKGSGLCCPHVSRSACLADQVRPQVLPTTAFGVELFPPTTGLKDGEGEMAAAGCASVNGDRQNAGQDGYVRRSLYPAAALRLSSPFGLLAAGDRNSLIEALQRLLARAGISASANGLVLLFGLDAWSAIWTVLSLSHSLARSLTRSPTHSCSPPPTSPLSCLASISTSPGV